jgi:hypothetical protein
VEEFFYCSRVILFSNRVLSCVGRIFVEETDFIKENKVSGTLAEFYTNMCAFLESGQYIYLLVKPFHLLVAYFSRGPS